MRMKPEETCAVVIDMQERLMPAMLEKEQILERSVMLLKGLKTLGIPVIMTQQYTRGLGETLPEIREAAGTADYIEKTSFSCAEAPAFAEALQQMGRKNVLVIGGETHICVLQTCMDLQTLGYRPVIVRDCVSSRKAPDRETGLWRAMQEGITITSAEAVLFEMLRDAKSPHFKEISRLVK